MPIRFTNTGAAAGRALRDFLVQREVEKRQALLDGIAVEDRMRQRAREEQALQRQAALDEQAAEDRQRRIEAENTARDLAPFAPGDLVDDALGKKYPQHVRDGQFVGTPGQREAAAKEAARLAEREEDRKRRELEQADAAGNRYLDAELGRQEHEANRRSNERVASINASGRNKKDDAPTHDAAAVTLDALDELSARINDAEGLAAKVSGSWKSAAASANYDDDVAEYNAVLTGAIPSIARKMGHTGVLTENDVASVRGMFPQSGDSKSLRDRKMARIRRIMNMPGGNGGGSGNGRSGGSRYAVTVED